jgi:hypothetical protein
MEKAKQTALSGKARKGATLRRSGPYRQQFEAGKQGGINKEVNSFDGTVTLCFRISSHFHIGPRKTSQKDATPAMIAEMPTSRATIAGRGKSFSAAMTMATPIITSGFMIPKVS